MTSNKPKQGGEWLRRRFPLRERLMVWIYALEGFETRCVLSFSFLLLL